MILAFSFAWAFDVTAEINAYRPGDITPEECVSSFEGIYDRLAATEPLTVTVSAPAAQQALADLFAARASLHEAQSAFYAAGRMSPECARSIRRVDLAWRYFSDHLQERALGAPSWQGWSDLGTPLTTLSANVRSGDVLVTRAALISSAGIAHIASVDAQFSHNVLIHRDGDKVWTVEAYMESGAVAQRLDDLFKHPVARVVVMRPRDPALGERAARAAFQRVRFGKRIPYDDDLDSDDPTELFCSETARWAYGPLLGLPYTVPVAQSTFPIAENPAMYAALGVTGDRMSAPADILFDPQFTYVAEWRDPAQILTLRRHDAVVEAMMGWMERGGYVLEVLNGDVATVKLGRTLRRIPLLGLALKGSLAPDSDLDFLSTSLALQNVGKAVDATLLAQTVGRPDLDYRALQQQIEAIRLADLEVWRRDPSEASFHRWLHPNIP